jgi:hypothetical protein
MVSPAVHEAEHLGQQPVDRHRRAAQQQPGRVADPALELAGEALGAGRGAALGRVAHEERPVVGQHYHGGDRRHPVAERDDLGAPAAGDGRGRVRRAEIDPQAVGHRRPTLGRTAPLTPWWLTGHRVIRRRGSA